MATLESEILNLQNKYSDLFIRTQDQLKQVIQDNPFCEHDKSKVLVYFLPGRAVATGADGFRRHQAPFGSPK